MKLPKFLTLTICIVVVACAGDSPSPGDGKSVLEAKYHDSACLKLLGFDKLDGQASEFGGVKGYTMKYSASMELKPECFGYFNSRTKKFGSEPRRGFSEQGHKNMTELGYLPVKPGEKVAIEGRISFSKSEKGWTGQEIVF